MLTSISKEQLSHVLIFINSLEGHKLTNVSAVASFVFTDESRMSVWYVRQADGSFQWMCSQFSVHINGVETPLASFSGPLAADLLKMAETCRMKVKAKFRIGPEKVFRIVKGGAVEEISLAA